MKTLLEFLFFVFQIDFTYKGICKFFDSVSIVLDLCYLRKIKKPVEETTFKLYLFCSVCFEDGFKLRRTCFSNTRMRMETSSPLQTSKYDVIFRRPYAALCIYKFIQYLLVAFFVGLRPALLQHFLAFKLTVMGMLVEIHHKY